MLLQELDRLKKRIRLEHIIMVEKTHPSSARRFDSDVGGGRDPLFFSRRKTRILGSCCSTFRKASRVAGLVEASSNRSSCPFSYACCSTEATASSSQGTGVLKTGVMMLTSG